MPRSYWSRRHKWLATASFILLVILLSLQKAGWLGPAASQTVPDQPGSYSINHFVDGDTIAINMNGKVETVRFVGVDTPETHKPNTPVQCYGPAAAAFTKNTIGNSHVRLVSDSLSTDRDRYNRLLRYVYLNDGKILNEKLIQEGYGFYYPYFPFTKSAQFEADEKLAMATHKGLWGNCHPTETDRGGYVSNPA
ncbi:MAG TPA: thermonuclease family protein [Candidatus Saccharimonadales bacterium]|nr:thermonuclease family protein [Candidatus Saccharimonadales bacterium]